MKIIGMHGVIMSDELVIDWIGGNCPVQAEGTIAGKPFYFRARGRRWSLEVEDRDADDDTSISVWEHQEPYGDGPYDAGWMSEEEARSFIAHTAERYLKEIDLDNKT